MADAATGHGRDPEPSGFFRADVREGAGKRVDEGLTGPVRPDIHGRAALACACAALLGPVWTIEPGMLTINLMLLGLAGALLPVILRQVRRRDRTTPVRHRAVPA